MLSKKRYSQGSVHVDTKGALKARSGKNFFKETNFVHCDKVRFEYDPDKKELIIKRMKDLH